MIRLLIAVMHCNSGQYKLILALANSVLKGVYDHVLEYATPPMSKADFENLLNNAAAAQALVKQFGKSARANRNAALVPLFTALKRYLASLR